MSWTLIQFDIINFPSATAHFSYNKTHFTPIVESISEKETATAKGT